MDFINWLKILFKYYLNNAAGKANVRKKRMKIEKGTYEDESTYFNKDFAKNYEIAMSLMKDSINKRFPDRYEAISRVGYDPNTDYSGRRSEAINLSSAVISGSLRNGSGIIEAVKRGHRSIGL